MVIQASMRQLGRLKYLNVFLNVYVLHVRCLLLVLKFIYCLPSGTTSVSLSFSHELIYILFFPLPPSNYPFVHVCDCDKLISLISRSLSFLRL